MRTPELIREHRFIEAWFKSHPTHEGTCSECHQERQLPNEGYPFCETCYKRFASNREARKIKV